ncbi:uncharacterized protein A4U43_C01F24960 [Asparagus officinalis]|uniref:Acetyltransferase n=1 Tax=Asparagus officinalis TaxID=4686 RepID=A0A5P1FRY7_ASPOF|nr:uncharacterized acetyltransferase At3g50280-like [Asparagus officinalis]ONK81076.1 uncharacterized protein A4U43_C01F24960 [Asparagus officinalis]
MATSPPPMIVQVSKCLVKPSSCPNPAVNICHLTHWDLPLLSLNYIQKGLLFSNLPSAFSIESIIDRLMSSLSVALCHFYPLAGRLKTERVLDNNGKISGLQVSIDCKSQGAEFIYAIAPDVTISDVLAPSDDIPSFLQSFFPFNGAINHDGHTLPLLAIQLTKLSDGIFLACCFNHVVGDGTSYWHFFNAWAEIARSTKEGDFTISRPPVHDRWFIEEENPPIKLPFSDPEEYIERPNPPPLREKIFHFSSQSIAQLKAKANKECNTDVISSFQALSALIWRSVTRARCLPPDQKTSCLLSIQYRARLQPQLSPDYFGNSMSAAVASATVGELMAHGLGWAASLVHQSVTLHTDTAIREFVRKYHQKPVVYRLSGLKNSSLMIGSSPRFDMYGCDFGWGKAVALRSGIADKFGGKVTSYPGQEGGGSVDIEVCLLPESMASLEVDEEFMACVSPSQ